MAWPLALAWPGGSAWPWPWLAWSGLPPPALAAPFPLPGAAAASFFAWPSARPLPLPPRLLDFSLAAAAVASPKRAAALAGRRGPLGRDGRVADALGRCRGLRPRSGAALRLRLTRLRRGRRARRRRVGPVAPDAGRVGGDDRGGRRRGDRERDGRLDAGPAREESLQRRGEAAEVERVQRLAAPALAGILEGAGQRAPGAEDQRLDRAPGSAPAGRRPRCRRAPATPGAGSPRAAARGCCRARP